MNALSRTPVDVPINPRHPQFELADCLSRDWHGNDPFRTAFFNALSLTFPKGEKFFIDSVRAFQRGIGDPKLSQEIRGFIGQEAIHSREHKQMNDMLCSARGYDANYMDARLDRDTAWANENLEPITRLGATVTTEHLTAILGNALLTNPAWLDGADPRMAAVVALARDRRSRTQGRRIRHVHRVGRHPQSTAHDAAPRNLATVPSRVCRHADDASRGRSASETRHLVGRHEVVVRQVPASCATWCPSGATSCATTSIRGTPTTAN